VRGFQLLSWEGHTADYWRRAWQAGAAYFFDSVTSTNDVAAELAEGSAPDFTVVLAEEQTRGRGRGGSRWQAEYGTALLFSVVIRIARDAQAPGCAPIRAGLAVAEAISTRTRERADVKWPNDVVINDCGKAAGILCESVLGQQGPGYIVVGIGINVLQASEQFAPELRGQACSLLSATGIQVDRSVLLTDVITQLRSMAHGIAEPLTDDELARLAAVDVLRDRAIVCETGGVVTRGVGRGVARDGALLVEQAGIVSPVYNATVRLAGEAAYPGRS
jgi:BirA family transcriptional regulator, biotin operon repressor / biotin---[acetyl-CoA-carboxylase] ligase